MKKKRALLISCSVILLCICVVAGMSYALFTDSVRVNNHLQAGNLDVSLHRVSGSYSVLNDGGILVTHGVGSEDFTNATEENIFGMSGSELIVPGSTFEATLRIKNNGNVAFNYTVQLTDISNTELAEQLRVTVTRPDHTTETKMLKEFSGSILTGNMTKGTEQEFTIKLEFVDGQGNNAAMSGEASFDLLVLATQKTAR